MGVYQRGKSWWIEYRYKGKRYWEAVGPDRGLAVDVLAQRKVEIRENRFFPDKQQPKDPVTFHELAKEYIQWAKTNKKASTCVRELCIMRAFDVEFEGKHIHEITVLDIERWKSKRKEGRMKPATVNRELALLKHLFSMAVRWHKIGENPAREVKRLKGETKRVRFLMPDEVRILLSNCVGFLKPIIMVAVHTGMRKGEILGLKWPQVNFEQGIISVLDSKNHERRDIPMDETVRSTLKGLDAGGEFVFHNRNGNQIDGASLYNAFYEALDKSRITDFRFHDLRHTFASNLAMQEGVELNDIRELLGHKKMEMTLRYAHLSPRHKTRIVGILDKIMVTKCTTEEAKVVQLKR